ncbi:MAG: glycosyltransferase family 4 protein [Rhodocyclaceae bacterium]|nr:glycosyltransferase family 4 protein [Rhodocyclaceae bacterium]
MTADPTQAQAVRKGASLCFVVSSPMTVTAFLKAHIAAATEAGYRVSVVMNTDDPATLSTLGIPATLHPVAIERRISPWRDLAAVLQLHALFRRERFDLVHSISPKAGLLGMLAARLAGVPQRIHTFTGQVWATRTGAARRILKSADRLLAWLTTTALVDSRSQRDFLVTEGVVAAAKAQVIGNGSICGVDTDRFAPSPAHRESVRRELGTDATATIALFLGRLNRDKGILELAEAYAGLAGELPALHLVLVGPDEEGLLPRVRAIAGNAAARVHHVPWTGEPERYMAAADIFCLPSHREGFGLVAIEAAAVGLPVLASRIYGVTDAVAEGETGLLHPPGDIGAIATLLRRLAVDEPLRQTLGGEGRDRALREFGQREVVAGQLAFYGKILN